jgi:mycothiol synthase
VNERPLQREDAETVAALVRAEEEAIRHRPSHVERRDVEMWWSRADLANDSWLVEDDGDVVAAGWFSVHAGLGDLTVSVAPAARGRELEQSFLERGEAIARERKIERLHTWIFPEDEEMSARLVARGYREVRRFYEMAIELEAEPAVPVLAEPLVLEPARDQDARGFHAATTEAFADHWEWHETPFDEWWKVRSGQLEDEGGPLWFLVRDGDEIAAVIRNEMRENGGYVGILGVRRPWRGRGLGKALLYRAFAEFWHRGARRVSLGVDAESPTGATKLYESVGMKVESAVAVYEKSTA